MRAAMNLRRNGGVSLDEALDEIEARSGAQWVESLEERKQIEVALHDEHRQETGDGRGRQYANSKYYRTTRLSKRFITSWLETHARDRVVLDFACGTGIFGFKAADAGASRVVGIDISGVSVAAARRRAGRLGLESRMRFVQADCEQTGLPPASFDVALCGGVLHHLDLDGALSELQRLLKPGGMLLAVEPLNINPAFQLYRKLTAYLRTEYEAEHILSLADIKRVSSFFEVTSLRFFHQLSPLAGLVYRTPLFRPVLAVTDAIDQVLTRTPLVRLMSWQLCLSARNAESQLAKEPSGSA